MRAAYRVQLQGGGGILEFPCARLQPGYINCKRPTVHGVHEGLRPRGRPDVIRLQGKLTGGPLLSRVRSQPTTASPTFPFLGHCLCCGGSSMRNQWETLRFGHFRLVLCVGSELGYAICSSMAVPLLSLQCLWQTLLATICSILDITSFPNASKTPNKGVSSVKNRLLQVK